ncbi:MAG: hypothetical protein IJY93_04940 [Clostridia bacterium]|nr:hypothetical protein [Clostridia bacterium]
MNTQFVLGAANTIVTPPLGTLLYGYGQKRPASRVNDDLRINALAFGNGKPEALLIGMDLCSLPVDLAKEMQQLVCEHTGIAADRIVFAAIHTHSGPSLTTTPGWGDANTDYIENTFKPRTLEAVKAAVQNAVPVLMGVGTTESHVGINRRQIMKDGSVDLGQNPYGINDPTMTVLSFVTHDRKPVANLIHYGCHGTAAGFDTEITRDWPGYMVDRMEEQTGAMTVFVNGTMGDTGPNISNGLTIGDMSYVRELGSVAATDAVRAYRTIKEYNEVCYKSVSDVIRVPYRELAPLKELQAEFDRLDSIENRTGFNGLRHATFKKRLEIVKSGEARETHNEISQILFAFNSVVLVPYPFEVFSEIALRLREYSPYQHTLTISNANGAYAYLPSHDQICRGGYEITQFTDRHPYAMVENADDYFIRENLRIMEKLC